MLIHDYGHECITSLFTAATQYSQVYFCSVDSLLDYEQSLFLLKLSSEKGERRIWPRTWLKERGGRGAKNVVCYTAVFSVVTQRSSPLRDNTKNGCVADYQKREWFVFPLGHSGLPPSFLAFRPMLARVCTPLTKSQEKEGLTPVY